jgi:signal transduction histidine kinase
MPGQNPALCPFVNLWGKLQLLLAGDARGWPSINLRHRLLAMGKTEVHSFALRPQRPLTRVRRRTALAIAGIVSVACLVTAISLLTRAAAESRSIRDRALAEAVSLSFALDQEVTSGVSLLKGLSQSPALKSGDLKEFSDQLKATPIPEGAWLILWNLDGQLLNTLRPFGTKLPKLSDFPPPAEALARLKAKGFTVSGRALSLVANITTVALSLRLDGSDGEMKGFLTTVIPETRLRKILDGLPNDRAWKQSVLDRKLQTIIKSGGSYETSEPSPATALSTHLGAIESGRDEEGVLEDVDEQGVALLLAYRRSGLTDWTTVTEVPKAIVDAPIRGVLKQIGLAALVLASLGLLAAKFLGRQFEAPLEALSATVRETQRALSDVSGQLLSTQEEERRRIAAELHDSTAQHLVAASLNLVRLSKAAKGNAEALARCDEIDQSLDQALKELRVFTYLLYPPDLASDGLSPTIRKFVDGFSQRTGLVARLRVSTQLGMLPSDLQHSMLRVVQEGLANVYRHAGASRISVTLKTVRNILVLRISDDGRGIAGSAPESLTRLGVGIPGMRTRLQQLGGELKIKTGPWGTILVAFAPIGVLGLAKRARRPGRAQSPLV